MNLFLTIVISTISSSIVSYLLLKRHLKIIDKITTSYLDEIKNITTNKP